MDKLDNRISLKKNILIPEGYIYHRTTDNEIQSIYIIQEQGLCIVRLYSYINDQECEIAYVDNLSVEPEVRKAGLGTYMMNVIEKISKACEYKELRLLVQKDKWMFDWYKRRGFVFYQDYDNEWVWMKKLIK